MGRSKARRNRQKRAKKDLAVKTVPISTTETETPRALIARAVEKANEFDSKQALKFYRSALSKLEKLHPTDEIEAAENLNLALEALQASALILLEQGRVDEAKESAPDVSDDTKSVLTKGHLQRALSNAYCAIAELYMTDLCDEPEAESNCRQAVQNATEADGKNPQAWLSTANFLTVKAENEGAKDALEKCLALYWPKVERAIADLQSREDRELLGEESNGEVALDTSEENVEEANTLDLEEISGIPFEAHVQMARMMMELDMNEWAAEVLEALLEEDDEYPEIFYLLTVVGQILWKDSDPERLRHYAKIAKQMCTKIGDLDLAEEMASVLETLPPDDTLDEDDLADDDDNYDVISSSGDEDEDMDVS
uniref:TPR_REGION domain-containing protein n=1 Tax=Mesocestoides corti TaxID=53468 RepID=A0A5K3FVZ4_MESCO